MRRQLLEIQELSGKINRHGEPEIRLFAAGDGFSAATLAGFDFRALDDRQLRAVHAQLQQQFAAAVDPEVRCDDLANLEWRNRMYAILIGQADETVSEETLLGLSSEFFMQIQWLPGGRIEEGELIFDPIFEGRGEPGEAPDLQRLYDEKCRGIIFNFVREYGDLEYINVGRVIGSLSRRPSFSAAATCTSPWPSSAARPSRSSTSSACRSGASANTSTTTRTSSSAIIQSEEYTEYILDRRLGCRQLGMNLPARVTARKLSERYHGKQGGYHGTTIWSTYFQRDYIRGVATDKIPAGCLRNEAFALALARLLGRAAAPNMIVGRCDLSGNVLFDDGDEVVVEDAQGMPVDIVVADQTGTFVDYIRDLKDMAAVYARPVNRRAPTSPARRASPRPTSTRSRSGWPAFKRNTASAAGRSTRSSSIGRGTRKGVSPIAGSGCCNGCSAPTRHRSRPKSAQAGAQPRPLPSLNCVGWHVPERSEGRGCRPAISAY